MGLFLAAWLAGESMVFARWVKLKAPPPPGALAVSSVLFIGLAVIAEYQPARGFAVASAFGLDLAILLQLVGKTPQGITGWPPPLIDNPAVLFPDGSSQGDNANQPAGPSGPPPPNRKLIVSPIAGLCPPGYVHGPLGYCYWAALAPKKQAAAQ